jgi:hypothetical protein
MCACCPPSNAGPIAERRFPRDAIEVVLCEVVAYVVGDEGGFTRAGLRHIKTRAAYAGYTAQVFFVAGPQRGPPFVWGDLAGVIGVRAVSAREVDLLVLEILSDDHSKRLVWRGITMRVRMSASEVPDFVSGRDRQVRRRQLIGQSLTAVCSQPTQRRPRAGTTCGRSR